MGQKVFLDYDQAGLDSQLNLRARWPEHGQYFTRWAEDSAAVRRDAACRLDLAFGPTPGQTLDLFLPAGVSTPPVLAFIHGGYWQALDKGDFSYLAPPFLAQGVAFASLNYDLAPQVTIEEIVHQVRRALAWIYREARDLEIDPSGIHVAGHSAGGQLAAMALSTDWAIEGGGDLPADLVKSACSISGVYDLEAIRLSFLQAVVQLDPDTAKRMSPLGNLPDKAGKQLFALGSEETEEFHRQQAAYFEAWRGAGLTAEVIDLPGRNHFSAVGALGEPDHPLFAATLALIRGDL